MKKIFEEVISRKPDYHPWTKQFVYAMLDNTWNDREFDFTADKHDFKVNMGDRTREMTVSVLSCVAQIEVAVKKFWTKLGDNLPHPSLDELGIVMGNIEVVHNLAYERLLDELDMADVFEKNLELDVIKNRVNYLRKYTHKYYKDSKKQYLYALILFTLYVENVSLFWQFYVITHLHRHRNLLKDTAQQVKYTSREELLHAKAGIKIVNIIRDEYPELFDAELEERITSSCVNAFNAEKRLIEWAVGDYKGVDENGDDCCTKEILEEFIKNRLNESLSDIGFKQPFDVDPTLLEKTIWFDENVLGNVMTDFFNNKPVEYAKGNRSFDPKDLF